ncbi:MAG: molybdopterin converting factor subunit 1 [Pseudomonadota bacterium]
MRVLYFAWLREKIAVSEEEIAGDGLGTVTDLIEALREKSDRHAAAFADVSAIKAAVNQKVVAHDAPLNDAEEVAFFPPMTGG